MSPLKPSIWLIVEVSRYHHNYYRYPQINANKYRGPGSILFGFAKSAGFGGCAAKSAGVSPPAHKKCKCSGAPPQKVKVKSDDD